jgi:hypothetical protein
MSTTIDQYREAKNTYLKLKNQAKKNLLSRFHEVSAELLQIQRELLEDFGEKVAIPSKSKRGKQAAKSAKPAGAKEAPAQAAQPSAKELGIQKQLEKTRKKLADTQATGKPTKLVEDRIYELEDELRLARAN